MLYRFSKYFLFIVVCLFSLKTNAGIIDSLEKILSSKSGKEKVDILNRLAEEYRNTDPDKTNALAEQALAESKQLNYAEGEADAYHKKGIYFYFTDDFDKALEMYDKSLVIAKKINNQKLIAQALSWIGSLYRIKGDHKKALDFYNKALIIAKTTNDKNRIVYCLRSIGDDYRMQQENGTALTYFHDAIKIADEINDLDQKAYILTTLAEVYRLQSDNTTAIKTLNEAVIMCLKAKNYNLLSNDLYAIGEIYLAKNDFEKALTYYDSSLSTARQVKDKIRIADCYASMGDVYRLEKDLEKALDYYNAALTSAKEIDYPNVTAYCYMVMADVFVKKGDSEFAIAYLKKSKDIAEEIGDKHRLSEVYSQLGDLYVSKFDYNRAEENYLISLALSQEIGNQSTISSVYIHLGQIALANKEIKTAIINGEKGLKLATEIDNTQSIVDGSELLYQSYKKNGDYKKSLDMLEVHKNMSDTLKQRENSKRIFQQQIKFEYEEEKAKEQIISTKRELEHQAKEKAQQLIIWFSVVGLVIVMSLAVLIFIGNRKQKAANILLAKQNKLIENQKTEITDSINYAQRIQTAIMPGTEEFYSAFPESFILYKPKDIVSGDFYYYQIQHNPKEKKPKGSYVVAVADCTGHGVPGAFMSMISYQKLEEAVAHLFEPKNILKRLNKRIKSALRQNEADSSSRDGLDIALLSAKKTNENTMKIKFSGANRPLWIIRKKDERFELEELKVTKTSIGGFTELSQEFIQHDLELKKGDTLYMSSDGYADQFGGENNKKMTTKKFKNLLLEIQPYSMQDQYHQLTQFFNQWKGENSQIDDILVIGIRV